ncbi:MAG: aldehyde dehydrogenase family protein [Solirubrobacterales bacterium]
MEASTTETAPTSTNGSSGAAGASEGESFDVLRPTDGTVIRSIPISSAEEVAEVAQRLRRNQPAWEALGIEGRYRWLGRWRDWMLENREEIGDVLQEESGKVRADATLEAPYLASVINFYGENGAKFLEEETPPASGLLMKQKKLRVVYHPYQLVGAISPWNFPVILAFEDLIAAMTAGSAALLKPSEYTPLTAMRMLDAWKHEIGGPDVIEIVNGAADTGQALVDEVDYVQFTGSERGGKAVMKRAAETLTPVSLELGGKDPMIVCADSDIDRAVNAAAWGGLVNTGQVCISIERVYVEEPIYDEFCSRLTNKVAQLHQGADGRDYGAEVGAMTSPEQIGKVEDHVNDACEAGARVLTGGKRRKGAGDWFEPTVLADVDHSMRIMREETFGPVVPVMKVRDTEEAVMLANDTDFGLSATVFSGDHDRAEAIARRIEVGAVNINDALINYFAIEVPMGGWKSSGIGYRHGKYGIQKFVRSQSLIRPRFGFEMRNEMIWYPYSKSRRGLVARLFRLINARGLRKRLGL